MLDWKKPVIPGLGAVRESRHHIRLPIEVCAFDRGGRFFTEVTETWDVSESGCRCHLRTEVANNTVLAIRIVTHASSGMKSQGPILFHVARMESASGGWTIGASKLQKNDVWMPNLAPIKTQRVQQFD